MKKKILTVSSANIDFIQNVKKLPERGETTVSPFSYAYVPGGKGANSALTFARLGGDSVFCAKVGTDENGERLKRLYRDEDIDTRFIFADRRAATGLASIIVEEDGANRITVYPGANDMLTESDVEEAFTSYPDAVFLQFEIPSEAIYAAAMFASEKEIPLFVDAGPARLDIDLSKLGRVEVFSPNETECEAYTGIKPDSIENCLRACIRLSSSLDAKYIVLKLGHRGSFVYDGKHYNIIAAHKVQVVDTTAAGDIFTAALTYAYLQKNEILESVRFATLAAAISVTREGAGTSVPTLKEIKAYAKSIKESKK